MNLAVGALKRRPSRFTTAAVILSLIAALVLLLGGLLDGLVSGATNALLRLPGDVIVYSATSDDSIARSRVDAALATNVEGVVGVQRVSPLAVSLFGARLPDRDDRELTNVAIFGYEIPPDGVPKPPGDGEAYADRSLEQSGFEEGMTVLVGPLRSPVKIVGWVEDLPYSGQGTLWASLGTWRTVMDANRPDAGFGPDQAQVLVVSVENPDNAAALTRAIDESTQGATSSLTLDGAANAIPGVSQQKSTFSQIIGVTIVIAVIVVALFFALLTVERIPLYGVLKAIGATSGRLFGGLLLQALVVTLVASLVGLSLAVMFSLLVPPGSVPFELSPARAVSSLGFLLLAAIIGCFFSLRRVLGIDPAAAIGGGS